MNRVAIRIEKYTNIHTVVMVRVCGFTDLEVSQFANSVFQF